MVCGKFLDTGKILLGEEENKTEVLWLRSPVAEQTFFKIAEV